MNVSRRLSAPLVFAGILVVFAALPAFGADDDEAATTDAEVISESGLEPAVPIPDEPAVETVADWTYRYMIPATLVLVVVVIVLTSVRYFTNVVRNRYRTVEE